MSIRIRCCFGVILVAIVGNQVGGFTTSNRQLKHLRHSDLEMSPTVDNDPTVVKPDDFIKQEIEKQRTDSVLPTIDDIRVSLGTDDSADEGEKPQSSSTTSLSKRRDPRPFPLSMIIDQQEIKHALLLSAVNPRSIGVLISGGRGTG